MSSVVIVYAFLLFDLEITIDWRVLSIRRQIRLMPFDLLDLIGYNGIGVGYDDCGWCISIRSPNPINSNSLKCIGIIRITHHFVQFNIHFWTHISLQWILFLKAFLFMHRTLAKNRFVNRKCIILYIYIFFLFSVLSFCIFRSIFIDTHTLHLSCLRWQRIAEFNSQNDEGIDAI